MEFLTILYFTYTFIAFYFLTIYVLTYFQNKKMIYETIKPDEILSLAIIVTCFN